MNSGFRRQGRRRLGLALRRTVILSFAILSFPFLTGFGDTPGARNRRGNAHYRAKEYDEALAEYRSGQIIAPELEQLAFNSGNALFRMEEFESALREYMNAAASFDDELSAMSYYNAGTAELRGGDLDAAVESFKQSLRRDPGDIDAKYNLEVALALRDEREKQEQSDQGEESTDDRKSDPGEEESEGEESDQGEQDNEESGDDREEQDGQSGEDQDSEGPSGADQEDREQSSDRSQDDGEQNETSMSKEDAERLLDAIDRGERELLAELRAARARKREKVDKDW